MTIKPITPEQIAEATTPDPSLREDTLMAIARLRRLVLQHRPTSGDILDRIDEIADLI